MLTLYGIPNCDTVKKARTWLDQQQLAHTFHNYKKDGLDETTLQRWCDTLGFEVLLNQRGTTWRKLDEKLRSNLDRKRAVALMLDNLSVIKRPVLDTGSQLLVGFDQSAWESLL